MKKEDRINLTITSTPGPAIDYPDALIKLDPQKNIYILPPIENFKDYIFLFPCYSHEAISDTELVEHPHANFIFYQSTWHKPENIFKDFPTKKHIIESVYSVLFYYEKSLRGKSYYKFPYSYFDLTTNQQSEFKKKAVQPVRDLLSKYKLLTPDNRGKGTKQDRKMRELVRQIVLNAYKNASRKNPLPIIFIKNQLTQKLSSMFPDNFDTYARHAILSDHSIRRILKEAGLA